MPAGLMPHFVGGRAPEKPTGEDGLRGFVSGLIHVNALDVCWLRNRPVNKETARCLLKTS